MMIPRMSMHITRKHANLTLQERHEYREIMLREKPVLKANGNKKIRKLLKCPLCPAITQRIDNHIVKIHGKKRGSKITKALTVKARELEAQRATTSEQNKTLDETEEDKTLHETEEHRTKANMTKQFSTGSDGFEDLSQEDRMEEAEGMYINPTYLEERVRKRTAGMGRGIQDLYIPSWAP
nr:uncharacterized protein LOC129266499 [Lytechinus pictus]